MTKAAKNNRKSLLVLVVILILINLAASRIFKRFDLTADNRYTLSATSLDIVNNIAEPLYIDVFLEGEFPGEFTKLQTETQQLLEEFKAQNPNIIFQFVNPLENDDEREAIIESFLQRGLTPVNVTLADKGKQTQEIVFPWAIATYGERSVKIPLLKNSMNESTAEKVVSSVQHLEYAFANGFNTISNDKEKKIAVIKGNGQLHDLLMADFIRNVRENYFIGTFTLDSVAIKPNESLKYLQKYDLAIIAKPTEAFSDEEKMVLDQFVMNGGKSLWLIDQVAIEMDSLYNEYGSTLAYPRDLNLNDMFFKYGIRINPVLVKDVMATPIALATGETGSATQYTQYPWFYSPWIYPTAKHPIVNNIDGLKFEFANSIDILKNDVSKTVLLQSSQYSKPIGTPVEVALEMVQDRPDQSEFANSGAIPLAVLLEGNFKSVYENRVLPFPESSFKRSSSANKMIVVADGDIIRNQLDKDFRPMELGFDKWTNKLYGNKEFLMNSVNYLLDDTGLINIRSKHVELPVLDQEQVYANYTRTQVITVGVPLLVLLVFGFTFTFLRSRKYGR
ncbi:MAG: gliding motility-associated ABC transporter substrate-binding protein GldG [Flavobacterium sp.]|nr:gliding motility-associated ABC transporter substrate-binding protein GldG [Flavobacterium sp.]